ncbi:MAG TPA: PilZ domain-containing protein [Dongiaceae bacterium]|nr:PilZ domain-containing protein [Dongiaceae bacterium]
MSSYTLGYSLARGPEKRKDKRLPLPVFSIKIDGQTFSTVNWSLGGLLISDYHGNAVEDQLVRLDVKAKDDAAEFKLRISARVIRNRADRHELALKFEEMNPQVYDFFEQCFSRRFKR